jgi:hypothetical protein
MIFKKLKLDLSYNPALPLLGIYPKEYESGNNKRTCTYMFIAALFTRAKLWIWPRCPIADKQIKKMWYFYTLGLLSVTKNEI